MNLEFAKKQQNSKVFTREFEYSITFIVIFFIEFQAQ